ncbi:MAG: aminotransferase class I/II-fold pyridoxal phosphate-dependent enzyme [Clostridia bacterium]|nr:aminotransferase class I/II-fold pyridoxal phosphate-dependent enzyme [Clostridia bacterium]MDQ7792275.1 aminotransferase class I/II-fold pyridoxal phosphate-dependent enzyme [Clostridia bacterium]
MTTGKWAERLNPTVRDIKPSGIRRFFDMASEMKGVISLGVGEPDFVTPWRIRESSIYALEKGYTMYTANSGLPELRQEISRFTANSYSLTYDPNHEVLVTVGVSEALDLALRAVVAPGDEVIVPEPCYVSYQPCVALAGGTPVSVPTRGEDGFVVTAAQIEAAITPRTKALLLCYPNNPTGAIMPRAELESIAELCASRDILVISDEIYAALTYEGEHTCFADLPGMRDRTILLQGFSKAFAMTGWRVGYALGNADFIGAMTKIHQFTMLCAPITAQMAAIEALKNAREDMHRMVNQYNYRRRLVLKACREIGLPCFNPGGAFYVFPDIRPTGLTSEEFTERLIREEKVAVVPGNSFGDCGEGYIRCSYAASVENLTEAFKRIGRLVQRTP